MKTGIIYMATSKTSGKSYIGQTIKTLEYRKRKHKDRALKSKTHFHNAINKYGFDDFEWKILYKNIPQEQLDLAEICAIYTYDTYYEGYNSTLGGDDNPMNNPESRLKLSVINKGKTSPRKGKILSKETRLKLSMANKGKKHSKESRLKMSKSHTKIKE